MEHGPLGVDVKQLAVNNAPAFEYAWQGSLFVTVPCTVNLYCVDGDRPIAVNPWMTTDPPAGWISNTTSVSASGGVKSTVAEYWLVAASNWNAMFVFNSDGIMTLDARSVLADAMAGAPVPPAHKQDTENVYAVLGTNSGTCTVVNAGLPM